MTLFGISISDNVIMSILIVILLFRLRRIFLRRILPIITETRTTLFTGTCPVRQHTADGHYVGRCYHSTYEGRCHLHGDVSVWLGDNADLTKADDRLITRA